MVSHLCNTTCQDFGGREIWVNGRNQEMYVLVIQNVKEEIEAALKTWLDEGFQFMAFMDPATK